MVCSIHLKQFPPIHIPKKLLKNSSCVPEIAIYRPGPSREYTGRPNSFDDLGMMNLSTMYLHVLSRAVFTVVTNNVSKLSMNKAYGGVYFPTFYSLFPERTHFSAKLTPIPVTIVISW